MNTLPEFLIQLEKHYGNWLGSKIVPRAPNTILYQEFWNEKGQHLFNDWQAAGGDHFTAEQVKHFCISFREHVTPIAISRARVERIFDDWFKFNKTPKPESDCKAKAREAWQNKPIDQMPEIKRIMRNIQGITQQICDLMAEARKKKAALDDATDASRYVAAIGCEAKKTYFKGCTFIATLNGYSKIRMTYCTIMDIGGDDNEFQKWLQSIEKQYEKTYQAESWVVFATILPAG